MAKVSDAELAPAMRSRKGEILALAAMLCIVALIWLFGLLAEEVMEGDTTRFDARVASFFRAAGGLPGPIGPAWLREVGRDVTSLGSFVFLGFLVLAVIGYLLLIRKRAAAALLTASVLGGAAVSTVLKLAFDRPRPDLPADIRVFTASFPSGHAMLSAVTFLTLGAIMMRVEADRRVKTYFMSLAVFLTVAVGVSRVYLGVHYATDVLAGWCMGCAWAMLCWVVALWLQKRGQLERPGPRETA